MAESALEAPDTTAFASEGRARFAATVVVGHALKHLLTSGLSSVLMPEIKIGLSLTATQVGSLGSVQQFSGWFATMAAGYLGDRFTKKKRASCSVSPSASPVLRCSCSAFRGLT